MHAVRNWLIGMTALLALSAFITDAQATTMPDSIDLNSLENLYEQVKFNHAGHIALVKDCGECHHHTTGALVQDANCVRCHKNSGASEVVACKGCHLAEPFSAAALREKNKKAYHQDRPGLKGAYHQSCTGCHKKMSGPTGCQDCHLRKKKGDAFFSAATYAPAPGHGKMKQGGH